MAVIFAPGNMNGNTLVSEVFSYNILPTSINFLNAYFGFQSRMLGDIAGDARKASCNMGRTVRHYLHV